MKLLALNCNQCGAPLEVPAKAKFVTCNFCSTQLSVQRTDKVAYTEAIEEIQERTRQMSEDLKHLKKQSAVEDLDRSWRRRREQFMVRSQQGELNVPSKAMATAIGTVTTIGGLLWMWFAMNIGAPGPFPLFGVFFIGTGIFGAMRMSAKADDFRRSHRAYLSKRHDLLS
ncbi:MAG TPA: hypothetical protein EYQ74_02160 [Planctomycetes bacterium]|nr:hypothetical protein [Planctomycetota bacterium]HIK59437.1 hypothetical protein [Planctomycetota bacterium]